MPRGQEIAENFQGPGIGGDTFVFLGWLLAFVAALYFLYRVYRFFAGYRHSRAVFRYYLDNGFDAAAMTLGKKLLAEGRAEDELEFFADPQKVMHALEKFTRQSPGDEFRGAVEFFRTKYQPLVDKIREDEQREKQEQIESETAHTTVGTELEIDQFVQVFVPRTEMYYGGVVQENMASVKIIVELEAGEALDLEPWDSIEISFHRAGKGCGSFFNQTTGVDLDVFSVAPETPVRYVKDRTVVCPAAKAVHVFVVRKNDVPKLRDAEGRLNREIMHGRGAIVERIGADELAFAMKERPASGDLLLVNFNRLEGEKNEILVRVTGAEEKGAERYVVKGTFSGASASEREAQLARAYAVTRRVEGRT